MWGGGGGVVTIQKPTKKIYKKILISLAVAGIILSYNYYIGAPYYSMFLR